MDSPHSAALIIGDNFTPASHLVLQRARDAAKARSHEYVGTEHLLLGLIRESGGTAADILARLSDVQRLEQALDGVVPNGRQTDPSTDLKPFTSRSLAMLRAAKDEAAALGKRQADPEHLLVALSSDEKGIAGHVLRDAGVTRDAVLAHLPNDTADA